MKCWTFVIRRKKTNSSNHTFKTKKIEIMALKFRHFVLVHLNLLKLIYLSLITYTAISFCLWHYHWFIATLTIFLINTKTIDIFQFKKIIQTIYLKEKKRLEKLTQTVIFWRRKKNLKGFIHANENLKQKLPKNLPNLSSLDNKQT